MIATIFVNPLQFGPNEDFGRYPRTLDADLEVCRAEGVDLVFAPAAGRDVPGRPAAGRVDPGRWATLLEGAQPARPLRRRAHRGAEAAPAHPAPTWPSSARRTTSSSPWSGAMVADLDVPVEIVGVPTVREPDGLALSSRNRYLSADEREAALSLSPGAAGRARPRPPAATEPRCSPPPAPS